MNVTVEDGELSRLAADLDAAPEKLRPVLRGILSKGALNVKRDMISRFEGQRTGGYLPHFSRSISYDFTGPLEVEIGPESGKPQGGMGAAIEYGSSQHAPMPFANPALDAEEPKFVEQVGLAASRVLS